MLMKGRKFADHPPNYKRLPAIIGRSPYLEGEHRLPGLWVVDILEDRTQKKSLWRLQTGKLANESSFSNLISALTITCQNTWFHWTSVANRAVLSPYKKDLKPLLNTTPGPATTLNRVMVVTAPASRWCNFRRQK